MFLNQQRICIIGIGFYYGLAFYWLSLLSVARADPQLLVAIGREPVQAVFTSSTASGVLEFLVGDREQIIPLEKLVRWSTPQTSAESGEIILTDGSHLVLAEAWIGEPVLHLDAETLQVRAKGFGKLSIPREKIRALLLHPPAGHQQRLELLDDILSSHERGDRLLMSSGDRLMGQCLGIGKKIGFAIPLQAKPLELDLDAKVVAITFGQPVLRGSLGRLVVGLQDGSLLYAKSLATSANQLQLKLACDLELSGSNLPDVVHLRSLTASMDSLSDLEPAAYRHVPYLDIPWPLRRDRNVLGGPLHVSGRTYPKGLGIHTASRLTYDLPQGRIQKHSRFLAEVALDDAASDRGSVVFRVYLRVASGWEQAYASPVLRGGESPQRVIVELGEASQIALTADYADRGDERDYANWLDARLE